MQLHTGLVIMIMILMIVMIVMMMVMSRLLPLLLLVVVSRCEARDLLQGVAHVSGRIAEVSVGILVQWSWSSSELEVMFN